MSTCNCEGYCLSRLAAAHSLSDDEETKQELDEFDVEGAAWILEGTDSGEDEEEPNQSTREGAV